MLKEGFIVQWCIDCPSDGSGGCIPDQGDYREAEYATIEKARKKALEVLPEDFFGEVAIRPFELNRWGQREIDWDNLEHIS